MESANRYLREVYIPAFNKKFSHPAQEKGTAFVPYTGMELKDVLCEQHSRVVGNDNCVSFQGMKLQIPSDPRRCHYVKAKVRVHVYPDGQFAVFHGPRKLGSYNSRGELLDGAAQRQLHEYCLSGIPSPLMLQWINMKVY